MANKKRGRTRMALLCITTDSQVTYNEFSKITPLLRSHKYLFHPAPSHSFASPEAILLRSARLHSLKRAPRTPSPTASHSLSNRLSHTSFPFRPGLAAADQPLSNAAFA